ncbi:MAG: hypothetical protein QOJ29_3656 [Thermoleophilaceae bacterium]|nr:hypothetical protein [Thermoleophilaceae bacterium]
MRAVIDARDAASPQLRGWGWYVKALVTALREQPELELQTVDHGWPGPEAVFELLGLARQARGADVLHAPNCFLPPRRPCAGVVTIHDLAFEQYPDDFAARTCAKYRHWTPRGARSAQRVIAPSSFTRDDIARRYGVDADKIRVIPEAPVIPVGTTPPPRGPYILAVGDLRKKKNFVTLARAHRKLETPHRLVIAGIDAGESEPIRAAAPDVELPGYVSDDQLDALIRGADLLVHPSLYEGFGLILVEAMARDTPLVVANATALPETAGDAALYFEPLDAGALADAIQRALADPQPLIKAGRRRVAELSWQRTAAETLVVYREAAQA